MEEKNVDENKSDVSNNKKEIMSKNKKLIIIVISVVVCISILLVGFYFFVISGKNDEESKVEEKEEFGFVENVGDFVNTNVYDEDVIGVKNILDNFYFTDERLFDGDILNTYEMNVQELISFAVKGIYSNMDDFCTNEEIEVSVDELNKVLKDNGFNGDLTKNKIEDFINTSEDEIIALAKYNEIILLNDENLEDELYLVKRDCEVLNKIENDTFDSIIIKADKSDNKLVVYEKNIFSTYSSTREYIGGSDDLYNIYSDYQNTKLVEGDSYVKNHLEMLDLDSFGINKYTYVIEDDKYKLESIEKNVSESVFKNGFSVYDDYVVDLLESVKIFDFGNEKLFNNEIISTKELEISELLSYSVYNLIGHFDYEYGIYYDYSLEILNEQLEKNGYIDQRLTNEDIIEYINEENEKLNYTGDGNDVIAYSENQFYYPFQISDNGNSNYKFAGSPWGLTGPSNGITTEIAKVDILDEKISIYTKSIFGVFVDANANDEFFFDYYADYNREELLHSNINVSKDVDFVADYDKGMSNKFNFIKSGSEYVLETIEKNVEMN